jgi:hypothetical protein
MAAQMTVGLNPTDPSERTLRFDVTGAPGEIIWRFGDCTDHWSDPTGMDHTYTEDGEYVVIGHVGSTGQRMVETVVVAGVDP